MFHEVKKMTVQLAAKPDFDECCKRIEAWFHQEIIDRVPVRFHRHNAEYDLVMSSSPHASLKDRWMDAEFQAQSFLNSIHGQRFNAETFPVYMPNLGPNFYAAVHGAELVFGENTSWCEPVINSVDDLKKIRFSKEHPYYKQMRKLTEAALQICSDQFLVGYTDLHPGMDCAAAWRGTENLCLDLILDPGLVHEMLRLSAEHLLSVYDEYNELLSAHNQPSVTWMNIPIPDGRMHIPSNDFSFMISTEQFDEYALPVLQEEVKTMTHNVFHVDGIGVARHIDRILSVPEIQAIQWVQGMADDYPIMQHLEFIRYVQNKGASIIVDLDKKDLGKFMELMSPKGIFLWIATENEEEEIAIIKNLLRWK
jgi:hypothetical protein